MQIQQSAVKVSRRWKMSPERAASARPAAWPGEQSLALWLVRGPACAQQCQFLPRRGLPLLFSTPQVSGDLSLGVLA